MEIGLHEIAEAFSKSLLIRIPKKMLFSQNTILSEVGNGSMSFSYKSASEKVRQQFAETLEIFIAEATKTDDILVFAYEYGHVMPLGTINQNMTDELSLILKQLPELPMAESYSFPSETILKVVVAGRGTELCQTKFGFSKNISENLSL